MKSGRILLVEDHADTLKMMARTLRMFGHDVISAMSVDDAVAVAGRDPFDLLISDLGLPDGSGMDLLRVLRERGSIDAIAVSGYAQQSDVPASTTAAGFAHYLTKPVTLAALGGALMKMGLNATIRAS